ncbi:uncharacterized protein EV154DRAFT_557370 [Mucor mucedo]|uniref:uncharacterized protein n=1 Tax=Mucor mucedo TaxID=29922 RepID=UPI00221FB869|nr:uncharacterized protein EV154DRAFT_557370 [Mucor mucedo]KAI7864083.1 hypothetical protein EV154DRAFT_557370 [Mucor mucedo]
MSANNSLPSQCQEIVDLMRRMVEEVVNIVIVAAVSRMHQDQVTAREAVAMKLRKTITKAMDYYKAKFSEYGFDDMNHLGRRTILKPETSYTVQLVVDSTKKFFKDLDGSVNYENNNEALLTLEGKAQKAYHNTHHLSREFLAAYLGDRFGVNGVNWSKLKKQERKETMYMIESIVYYWNKRSDDSGIPPEDDAASRIFDLDANTPMVPLHLADANWIACEMRKINHNLFDNVCGPLSGSMLGGMANLHVNSSNASNPSLSSFTRTMSTDDNAYDDIPMEAYSITNDEIVPTFSVPSKPPTTPTTPISSMPPTPSMPSMPPTPSMPSMPPTPSMPSMPSTPFMPTITSVPSPTSEFFCIYLSPDIFLASSHTSPLTFFTISFTFITPLWPHGFIYSFWLVCCLYFCVCLFGCW